jgi:hypothetical protein
MTEVIFRDALARFAYQMETVLRKHDHKTGWRERPVEALVALMNLEHEEFKIALEFFEVEDVRGELVDIANFAMIIWDRLGMLDQGKKYERQNDKPTKG